MLSQQAVSVYTTVASVLREHVGGGNCRVGCRPLLVTLVVMLEDIAQVGYLVTTISALVAESIPSDLPLQVRGWQPADVISTITA
ncbi:hypothetical protein BAUCODRAFT_28710 [Baudoinia panamericana UAMH 10762]|uniref:Uncharacterized protein n=1 Tax=Baudoinia panamericana (strain UAMH 10762) TaxID=717646 RepID=M2N892_BAUPA|nr:uncharacterized protein BAUCODRAFT_28710 [Baudoinia panamericana UAMH 10762]EMD00359.1 hypothetical protein BAUCODRAFT_28710 [Baudoinia panamericana UAMH 10762]